MKIDDEFNTKLFFAAWQEYFDDSRALEIRTYYVMAIILSMFFVLISTLIAEIGALSDLTIFDLLAQSIILFIPTAGLIIFSVKCLRILLRSGEVPIHNLNELPSEELPNKLKVNMKILAQRKLLLLDTASIGFSTILILFLVTIYSVLGGTVFITTTILTVLLLKYINQIYEYIDQIFNQEDGDSNSKP